MIADNLKRVKDNIANAAAKSGRTAEDILLVAVTKSVPAEVLRRHLDIFLAENVTNFGENRVQEMLEKQPLLGADIAWHMIGNLQRNKVKFVLVNAVLIHSVDSLRLVEEISRQAAIRGICADILLEINIGGESSKHGAAPSAAADFAAQVMALPNLSVQGLMAIAPFVDNPEQNRGHFKRMAALRDEISAKSCMHMPILSMGMTGDYAVAIEEGATIVRVGTGIFGGG